MIWACSKYGERVSARLHTADTVHADAEAQFCRHCMHAHLRQIWWVAMPWRCCIQCVAPPYLPDVCRHHTQASDARLPCITTGVGPCWGRAGTFSTSSGGSSISCLLDVSRLCLLDVSRLCLLDISRRCLLDVSRLSSRMGGVLRACWWRTGACDGGHPEGAKVIAEVLVQGIVCTVQVKTCVRLWQWVTAPVQWVTALVQLQVPACNT